MIPARQPRAALRDHERICAERDSPHGGLAAIIARNVRHEPDDQQKDDT